MGTNLFQPKYPNGQVIAYDFCRPPGERPIEVCVVAYPGARQYFPPERYVNDKRIHLELKQGDNWVSFPFTIKLQKAMWLALFKVWVKEEKKEKYAKEFTDFIEQELLKGQMLLRSKSE